jgi:hypothetical protein
MDNLLVNKEKTHRKQTYELHPNISNNHVDIIGTKMWPGSDMLRVQNTIRTHWWH